MGLRIVSDSIIGQTLGHYKVVDLLGAGGMGVVYRAQDLKLGRQVALKVLPAGSGRDDEAVERFRREARTASSLNHPNICTIYGFDEQNDQLYLAMELLDGDPLDRKLSGKPLDIRLALDIATQVADALDAAHVGGILHRDIKPANIFLTRRGPVKVLDFGLAKLAPDYRGSRRAFEGQDAVPAHFSSVAGTTVGTIAYMSPEQARGEEVDPRTDLFSFGVVLYELVTGKQSFPGHTTAVIFDGILNRDPAPASTINALVPPELDRIIEKALEKDRALRYQTAADFGADLKRMKRNSTTKHAIPVAMQSSPDAATVVMPSGSAITPTVQADTMTASQFARATAEARESGLQPSGPISQTSVKTAVRHPSSVTVPGTKTGWAMGAGAAIIGIAVVAAGIGAWMARGNSAPATPADQTAAVTTAATSSIPPANTTPAAPPAATPAATPPPATVTTTAPAPAPPTPAGQVAGATGTSGAKPPVERKANTSKPPAPVPPAAPAVVSRDAEAAQRLEVARAKMVNNLNDQALADLQKIIVEYPGSKPAVEAAFMAAEIHEKAGRADEAMAAYVEFESRFKGDPRTPDAKLRRAMILSRNNRDPRAQQRAHDLLGEVARDYPGTPQAIAALNNKLKMEQGRDREFREIDPVLKVQVPSEMVTLRTVIEQFPNSPQTMVALNRLSVMLLGMDKWAEAAQALETLTERFPNNPANAWFRLAELYERRLNQPAKAKEAYGNVPKDSPSFTEAQKRFNRIK